MNDDYAAVCSYQKIIIVRATMMLMPTARRPTTIASSSSKFHDVETTTKIKAYESPIHVTKVLALGNQVWMSNAPLLYRKRDSDCTFAPAYVRT